MASARLSKNLTAPYHQDGGEGWCDVEESFVTARLPDNGGRRSGIDRRRFSYTGHIPERRAESDRRSGLDRRSVFDRRSGLDRRSAYGP